MCVSPLITTLGKIGNAQGYYYVAFPVPLLSVFEWSESRGFRLARLAVLNYRIAQEAFDMMLIATEN